MPGNLSDHFLQLVIDFVPAGDFEYQDDDLMIFDLIGQEIAGASEFDFVDVVVSSCVR